jgi:hypothetical protein
MALLAQRVEREELTRAVDRRRELARFAEARHLAFQDADGESSALLAFGKKPCREIAGVEIVPFKKLARIDGGQIDAIGFAPGRLVEAIVVRRQFPRPERDDVAIDYEGIFSQRLCGGRTRRS